MKVAGDWLSCASTQEVLSMLSRRGHAAWVVGGCVRNALLDVPVTDVDIATDARPEAVLAMAAEDGLHGIPTGIEHGTVTIVADGTPHEITTFRRDVETDGRHAVVAFADTLEEDAARRDFTMNALYASAAGVVTDPVGGLSDLRAGRVRFIGRPEERIAEDALRILRFFRFHALYGDPDGGIDADGLAAAAAAVDALDRLSAERIGTEIRKLLASRDPAPAVAAMGTAGVLARVLPGADAAQLAPLVAVEAEMPPRWERRFVALGGAEDRLRLSRAETRALAAIRAALGEDDTAVAAYRHGAPAAIDAGLIRAAATGQPAADVVARAAHGAAQIFPLRAADLMDRIPPGPALGAALAALEAEWIASGFSANRDSLLASLG